MPLTPHERRYAQSKKTPSLTSGQPYKCTIGDVWDLLHPEFTPDRNWYKVFYLTLEDAVRKLERALDPARTLTFLQERAVARLQKGWADEAWTPCLVVKAFTDIDLVLFGGVLRGNVRVKWLDNEEGERLGVYPEGHRYLCWSRVWGLCRDLTSKSGKEPAWCLGKSEILLNSTNLLLNRDRTIRDVWGVLLHEMIHAYILHLSGRTWHLSQFEELCWGNKGFCFDRSHPTWVRPHGPHFRRIVTAINKRCEPLLGLRVCCRPEEPWELEGTWQGY